MINESVSVLGAVIALVYVGAISSILWWMLHIPSAGNIESHVRRIQREQSRFAHIVVPVQGDSYSDRLVALASQMARYRGASMDVLYVAEVPQTLPLSAVSEEQRARADQAFTRAEKIAHKYDVKISKRLQAARHAGASIVQYAQQTNCDLLLLSDVPKSNRRGTRYARSVEYVFEHAPCEVIIDRPPLDAGVSNAAAHGPAERSLNR
jgi:nucleotide-binding universal stress UspA family protein